MEQNKGFWHTVYAWLASLKLTVFLLLALAVSSVFGTLLPQGLTEQQLQMRYGPKLYALIDFFNLDDLYHSGWFRVLMTLLCVNLITCTLRRLPKTLKMLRRREERLQPGKLEKFAFNTRMKAHLPLEEVRSRIEKVFRDEFAPLRHPEAQGDYGGVAEKGRWNPWMVYVVHFSVLVIFLGALAGSIFGFKGFMNIPEGQASERVILANRQEMVQLPFRVRCDDFTATFYPETGSPKDFRSELVILENGQEALKRTIRVNDPLKYEGITFYQSSYGSQLEQAVVEFEDMGSGESHQVTLPFREPRALPGTDDTVQVVQFHENFSQFGPALGIAISRGDQEPTGSWILVDHPDFHGNRLENYRVKVASIQQTEYTGLQVKKDPGVWVVWVGFTALLIGIGATFYSSHRKVWIHAENRNPAVEIFVAGRTNKNSLAFEKEFNHLCEHLRNEINTEGK